VAGIIVVGEISTLTNRGQNISLFWASALLGLSLGPTLGGFIGEFLGDRAVFFCFSGLALLAASWFYLRLPETKAKGQQLVTTKPAQKVGLPHTA